MRHAKLAGMGVAIGLWTMMAAAVHAAEGTAAVEAPAWAGTQAFPTTRAYVAPPRMLVLGFHALGVGALDDSTYSHEDTHYGAWWGLPHRLAVEASLLVRAYGVTAPPTINQQAFAVRWAWADWGRLWGNPGIAASYQANNAAQPRGTVQLTLSDTWPKGLWGINVECSRDLRGPLLAQTYGALVAMGWAWADLALDAGAEGTVFLTDNTGSRFTFSEGTWLAGPYVRWAPWDKASLLFDCAFGTRFTVQNGVTATQSLMQPKVVVAWSL